jgi:hypothetical protein
MLNNHNEILSQNRFFDPVEIQNFMAKVIKKDGNGNILSIN